MSSEWISVTPQVDNHSEFFEIANDFGNPLAYSLLAERQFWQGR